MSNPTGARVKLSNSYLKRLSLDAAPLKAALATLRGVVADDASMEHGSVLVVWERPSGPLLPEAEQLIAFDSPTWEAATDLEWIPSRTIAQRAWAHDGCEAEDDAPALRGFKPARSRCLHCKDPIETVVVRNDDGHADAVVWIHTGSRKPPCDGYQTHAEPGGAL